MDIEYFDICSGALLCDVMHDLLEGVLQYETKLLLVHCIDTMNYFALKSLNSGIASLQLPCGTNSDRPAMIERKTLRTHEYRLNQKGRLF